MVLHQLTENAYQNLPLKNNKSFRNWRSDMENVNPQFSFRSIALKMEMNYLMFLRSIRSSNFGLYVSSIGKFWPWIFVLNHVHYARWLTIHQYDMEILNETLPEIYHKFNMEMKISR